MSPSEWGHHMWYMIHIIAKYFKYDKNYASLMEKFIDLLQIFIPCPKCSVHFEEMIIQHPLSEKTMKNSTLCIQYFINIHNVVNERLKKEKKNYTMDDVKDWYQVDEKDPGQLTYTVPKRTSHFKNIHELTWPDHFWYSIISVSVGMPKRLNPEEVTAFKEFFLSFALLCPIDQGKLDFFDTFQLLSQELDESKSQPRVNIQKWLCKFMNRTEFLRESEAEWTPNDFKLKYHVNQKKEKKFRTLDDPIPGQVNKGFFNTQRRRREKKRKRKK